MIPFICPSGKDEAIRQWFLGAKGGGQFEYQGTTG